MQNLDMKIILPSWLTYFIMFKNRDTIYNNIFTLEMLFPSLLLIIKLVANVFYKYYIYVHIYIYITSEKF